jgi:hypothetical protein
MIISNLRSQVKVILLGSVFHFPGSQAPLPARFSPGLVERPGAWYDLEEAEPCNDS